MATIFCFAVSPLAELIEFSRAHIRFELANWGFLCVLLAVLAVAGWLAPGVCRPLAARLEDYLRIVARRRWLAASLCAAVPLATGLGTVAYKGFPVPSVHDEFSYLLAAETFASGRMANPPFPVWEPFETFHVNQQPNYVSMYPPGQGLLMALGLVLFGHAWFGVLISVVLLGVLAFWALEAWFPRRWALAGGLMAGLMAACGYWLMSYFGGALAACGGALVIGAARRLSIRPRTSMALAFAAGLVILANTRMYEGAVLSVAAGLSILVAWIRQRNALDWSEVWRRTILPALAVGTCGLAWMSWYCWKTTGDPTLLPYVQNLKTYHVRRVFLFEPDRPAAPVYRHDVMRHLYLNELKLDRTDPESLHWLAENAARSYGGSLLFLPLAMLPWLFRDRRIRQLLVIVVASFAFSLLPVWIRPHYLAPAMVGIVGLTVQALRHIQAIRVSSGVRLGVFPVRTLLAAWFSLGFLRKAVGFSLIGLGSLGVVNVGKLAASWTVTDVPAWANRRVVLERTLIARGGRHLVLVRYGPQHNVHDEWVYNPADWQSAAVLWAREMDGDWTSRLAKSMPDRTLWIVEPDESRKPILRPLVVPQAEIATVSALN